MRGHGEEACTRFVEERINTPYLPKRDCVLDVREEMRRNLGSGFTLQDVVVGDEAVLAELRGCSMPVLVTADGMMPIDCSTWHWWVSSSRYGGAWSDFIPVT